MNRVLNPETEVIDLGLIDYHEAWDYQTRLFNETIAIKKENLNRLESEQSATSNYLIFCEHPHVFTLGKSGDEKNLLIKKEDLPSIRATYYAINRGGDITYHGPGQIVVYPVIDLENFFTDIHRYMRNLEEAVINTLNEFGIPSGRISGLTGVWLDHADKNKTRKIAAMGVKTSRWVTLHGLAFNVNPDLRYFDYIVPCGISDKAVTSMEKELGTPQNIIVVKQVLKKLIELFGLKVVKEKYSMIKDIEVPEVKNVTVAVVREKNNLLLDEWKVYLINSNDVPIENTLVASTGYGEKEGEQQKTSTLRHFLETVPANSSALVEPIDSAVFHLNNEYWVSYYIGKQLYDKRFVFVPDTICEENLTYIKALSRDGILHS